MAQRAGIGQHRLHGRVEIRPAGDPRRTKQPPTRQRSQLSEDSCARANSSAPNALLFYNTSENGAWHSIPRSRDGAFSGARRPRWHCRGSPPNRIGAAYGLTALLDGSGMVRIPAGEFRMGSAAGEPDEQPVHRVRISRDFEIGKFEVTQAQWETVMLDPHAKAGAVRTTPEGATVGSDPSRFKGASLPVESVSWDDIQVFLARLNARDREHTYRLPTEAEWEYACRDDAAGLVRARVVQRQLRRPHAAGRRKAAERARPVRHAGQRRRVGAGLVRPRLLRGESGGRSAGASFGLLSRLSRWKLAGSREVLPHHGAQLRISREPAA